jgi:hypothetical protein
MHFRETNGRDEPEVCGMRAVSGDKSSSASPFPAARYCAWLAAYRTRYCERISLSLTRGQNVPGFKARARAQRYYHYYASSSTFRMIRLGCRPP